MRRRDYVAALRRERDALSARPEPPEARLAAIDVELDRYDDVPERPQREKSVPGPLSRSRGRGQGSGQQQA